jgi:hypothetical protein
LDTKIKIDFRNWIRILMRIGQEYTLEIIVQE